MVFRGREITGADQGKHEIRKRDVQAAGGALLRNSQSSLLVVEVSGSGR
jgi:hypothetical protein